MRGGGSDGGEGGNGGGEGGEGGDDGEGGNGGGEGGDGQCAFWFLEQYSVMISPIRVEIIPVFRPRPGQTCSQLKARLLSLIFI